MSGPVAMLNRNSPSGELHNVWQVTFWAEHKSPFDKKPRRDWRLIYAYRVKRKKGLNDCNKFMDRVTRAIIKSKFVEAK